MDSRASKAPSPSSSRHAPNFLALSLLRIHPFLAFRYRKYSTPVSVEQREIFCQRKKLHGKLMVVCVCVCDTHTLHGTESDELTMRQISFKKENARVVALQDSAAHNVFLLVGA